MAKKKKTLSANGNKIIATNRRARHDYTIERTFEAGIQLVGTEIKSIRDKAPSITDSYISISEDNEAFIENLHIAEYFFGSYTNHSPRRKRKLLLHSSEIKILKKGIEQKGYTIVALSMYFVKGRVKLEIALAKGKKLYDKRQALKEKQQKLDAKKEYRNNEKYIKY